MNADRMKLCVEAAGPLGTTKVETAASPVSGSPHGAVYLFLTEAEVEGPHVLITDAEDVGEGPGFLVGAYFEEGEQMDEPSSAATYVAAAGAAFRLQTELSGITG